MMIRSKSILSFLLILSFHFFNAQTDDIVYKNDFGAADSKWNSYEKENAKAYLKDGRFVLEHFKKKLIWYHPISVEINPSLDFEIKATLRQVSGERGSSYGFFWGSKDVNNAYYVNLNDSGFFRIFYFQNKVYNELMPWRLSKAVKKIKKDNKILIKRKASNINIFINDQLIYEKKFLDYVGSEMCF